jgi:aminopeptidase N
MAKNRPCPEGKVFIIDDCYDINSDMYKMAVEYSDLSKTMNSVGVFTQEGKNQAYKDFWKKWTGQNFSVKVFYNGTPPTAATNPLGGSGMSNATSPTWGNKVTWSLSEPFSAYEWWPCKQSLTDKADSCAVKITVPSNCKAGSNGVLENVVDLGNGSTRYEWKHRHPIDFYLISVAVSKYVDYTIYANPIGAPAPIPIQNYIYDNPQCLPNFQADIDETVDFMELYWSIFGPYPFADEKYGHCMAPFSRPLPFFGSGNCNCSSGSAGSAASGGSPAYSRFCMFIGTK